jgi:hypothetical protein
MALVKDFEAGTLDVARLLYAIITLIPNAFANLRADNLINMFGVNISLGSDIVSAINLLIY